MPAEPVRVLIAGGGVAGIEAALALRQRDPSVAVELVTPDAGFDYRQLSVVEPFGGVGTRHVSYDALRALGVSVTQAALARVDAPTREAALIGGARRRYDALLVTVGAKRRIAF